MGPVIHQLATNC